MTLEEKVELYQKLYHKAINDMENAINTLIQSQHLKATEDDPPEDK